MLKLINKHAAGYCDYGRQMEAAEHKFLDCIKYSHEREVLVS